MKQPMQAGHTDINQGLDGAAQARRRHGGFFGDGHVARARGDDQDGRALRARFYFADHHCPRPRIVRERLVTEGLLQSRCRGFVRARGQDQLAVRHQPARDLLHLLRRLSRAVDDFRKALAQRPVMIHEGEAQVFKRQVAQSLQGIGHREAPVAD